MSLSAINVCPGNGPSTAANTIRVLIQDPRYLLEAPSQDKGKKGLCLAANSSACGYRQQLHSGPPVDHSSPPLTCVDGESQAVLNLGSPGASKHRQSPDGPESLPKGSRRDTWKSPSTQLTGGYTCFCLYRTLILQPAAVIRTNHGE